MKKYNYFIVNTGVIAKFAALVQLFFNTHIDASANN